MSRSNALGANWAWLQLHLPHWPHSAAINQAGNWALACLQINHIKTAKLQQQQQKEGVERGGREREFSKRCPDCGRQALSQRFKLRVSFCVCVVGCHVCAAVWQCWWFLRLSLLPELGVVAAREVRSPACDCYLLPVSCYLFPFPESSAWTCAGAL